jgi:hypothetical protein
MATHARREQHPVVRRKGHGQLIEPRRRRVDCLLISNVFGHTARDAEHAECGHERNDAQRGDGQTVDDTDNAAGKHACDKRRRWRPSAAQRQRGDDAAQRDDCTDGKIDAAADDDHRHTDGTDGHDDGLRQNDAQVCA